MTREPENKKALFHVLVIYSKSRRLSTFDTKSTSEKHAISLLHSRYINKAMLHG